MTSFYKLMAGKHRVKVFNGRQIVPDIDISERKRKKTKSEFMKGMIRSHKEDEKARRQIITLEFSKLKALIPNGNSLRARQEVLQRVKDIVWQIKRDQLIETLYRNNELKDRMKHIQDEIILRRDHLVKLRSVVNDDTMASSQSDLSELFASITDSCETAINEPRKGYNENDISFKTCQIVGEDSADSEPEVPVQPQLSSLMNSGISTVVTKIRDSPSPVPNHEVYYQMLAEEYFRQNYLPGSQELMRCRGEGDEVVMDEGEQEAGRDAPPSRTLLDVPQCKEEEEEAEEELELPTVTLERKIEQVEATEEDITPDLEGLRGDSYMSGDDATTSIDLQALLAQSDPSDVATTMLQQFSVPGVLPDHPQYSYFPYPYYYQQSYFAANAGLYETNYQVPNPAHPTCRSPVLVMPPPAMGYDNSNKSMPVGNGLDHSNPEQLDLQGVGCEDSAAQQTPTGFSLENKRAYVIEDHISNVLEESPDANTIHVSQV